MNPTLQWTMFAGVVCAIAFAFATFAKTADVNRLQLEHGNMVTTEQFDQFSIEVYYRSYYDTLDRIFHAEANGQDALAEELKRNLERIRAKICAVEPEWERCEQASKVSAAFETKGYGV